MDITSTTSIDTTSTTSIDANSTTSIDICNRATIDSSTRTSIDTKPRADMVATLVLQRDENGDLHDPGGHLCNAAEHAVEKDEDQGYIEKMESMIEKVLKIHQKTSAYLNQRLDVLYEELNGKLETLDAHVMILDAQVSQIAEAVKKQEALVKGKAVESERQQVNAISDDDFGEVLEQEKMEEDAFLVESIFSIGSAYWCRPTPTAEHRSTSSSEHRSTPLLGSDKTVRIQSHSDFAARHPNPPTLARVKKDNIDRQQHNVIDRQQHGNIDRQHQKSSDRKPQIPYRTIEKISQQSAEALEQKQTLAETSFVESVDRQHLPGPTADSNHQPAIPESASVDIRVAASVDFQSSESINNKHSESEDSQSSESIDTKLSDRSIPSDFQNSPRLKILSLGEGTRIERRKRKGMQMQIPYK
ncbi:hypothetical protein F2Q69_00035479 [Brassica cretica]|uniref:Uncharacterized protein n=1 Tax=Brassica cretica TaxID=69181 RepID=A0A8S9SNS4_BRACR|nr:hypothetical protein F2Q69_00035479 [Brassica cretica]